MHKKPVVIIGAGPAGLAAAYELVRQGIRPIVLEQSDYLGGIARTETHKGYHIDIGGHRFFTKSKEINRLWKEMMGDDFLKVERISRIYYQGRFFGYPLRMGNTLSNLGVIESAKIALSYIQAKIWPHATEDNLEQWITNRFGARLFQTFFRTYTEKVWGKPCRNIRADWAAQRIKGLSLMTAVANALFGNQKSKSLINEFDYPRKGPGMMWQRFQREIEVGGGEIRLLSRVVGIAIKNGLINSIRFSCNNEMTELPVGHLISSMPLPKLITTLIPKPPEEVLEASRKLSYRAFLIVVLIIERKALFPDQWIYIHDPGVKVGRIQNFKNWSAAMVPHPDKTSVGMEYFCDEDDNLWNLTDDELINLASKELTHLGLAAIEEVTDGFVVRQPKAYPIYDDEYGSHLENMRVFTKSITNLQTIGRNGMHRYNNMDHSMITGTLASRNILGANYDLWQVNEEKAYLEESDRLPIGQVAREKFLKIAFARMDKLAFATSVGLVTGLIFLLSTFWLLLNGNQNAIDRFQLLTQYFVGYSVSMQGALIAFGYSCFWGFLFAWLFAYMRNTLLGFYVYRVKKKTELVSFWYLIDHI